MKLYKIKFGDNKELAIEWGQGLFTVIDGYFDDEMNEAGGARWQTMFSREEIAVFLKTDDEAFVDSFIKRFGEEV